jgi:hypothetical protein
VWHHFFGNNPRKFRNVSVMSNPIRRGTGMEEKEKQWVESLLPLLGGAETSQPSATA